MTREHVASVTGLSVSAIEKIEAGRRASPRLATVAALAEAIGVSLASLLAPARKRP